ncbi:uncharacterized protein LOC106024458 isoform X2 [Esox lucius]|uniref:uncharacterized protein LOC106024458 isoform X2 n=1 Tax=Esox lucius TaxID=8010 RepID=UPI0010BCFCDD|nr:uncharacterized protein LOC106024458 isoform X2 [Esox lucius]
MFLYQPSTLGGKSHQPTADTAEEVQAEADHSRGRRTARPSNVPKDAELISSKILEDIFHSLQKENNSQTDPMRDSKFTSVNSAEPQGPTQYSKRPVNRILWERICFFGKGLIHLAYKMVLDNTIGLKSVAHQGQSQEDLVNIHRMENTFVEELLLMFCKAATKHLVIELMGLPSILDSGLHFKLINTDALGSTSRNEMWGSDSRLTSDFVLKQTGINYIHVMESSLICQSSDFSIDKNQAIRAICEVMLSKMRGILNRTSNNTEELLPPQKGVDSEYEDMLRCSVPEELALTEDLIEKTPSLLEKTPSLLHEEISLSRPSTVMSFQTLKVIIEDTMYRTYAPECPQSSRTTNSFGQMKDLLVEVKCALERFGISVSLVKDSVEFSEVTAVEDIVNVASKRMSLSLHTNRVQLYAARQGDKASIRSMANSFALVIKNYVTRYWSRFGDCSGGSSSSSEEILEEDKGMTPTEKQRWNSAVSGLQTPSHLNRRRNSASSAQCSRSSPSTDSLGSTTLESKPPITGVSLSMDEKLRDESVALHEEIHEELSLSRPSTVMSFQTLKVIIEDTMYKTYAPECPESSRTTNSFGQMKDLLVEVKCALERFGISVSLVKDSVEFSEVTAVEDIVNVASKRMSLSLHTNRVQLHAARQGDKASIRSMANSFALVIKNYVTRYWSRFGDCSGRSSSSSEEILEEDEEMTPTEKQRWNSAVSGLQTPSHLNRRRKSAGSAQCSRSSPSTDSLGSTTQESKPPITGVSLSMDEKLRDESVALHEEIHEELSLSRPSTVMSFQTLKVIIEDTMYRTYAPECPQSSRTTNSFGQMKDLLVEVKCALERFGISVSLVKDSVEFSEVTAVEDIVNVASKRMSLSLHTNRVQLHAARQGDKASIRSMANSFALVIKNYVTRYWSRFGDCSGRSSSSSEEILEEDKGMTPTEKQRWNSAVSGLQTPSHLNRRRKSAGSAQCSRSSPSTDSLGSTTKESKPPITGVSLSMDEKLRDEAVDQDNGRSEKGILRKTLFLKKNKVSPLCTTGPVAVDEPEKKRSLLKRITSGLAKIFCFPCKKRSKK